MRTPPIDAWTRRLVDGGRLEQAELETLVQTAALPALLEGAAAIRDAGHGSVVSVSRKVFVPLTNLCRDVCAYCTFAHPPKPGAPIYLSRDEVLAIARAGARAGATPPTPAGAQARPAGTGPTRPATCGRSRPPRGASGRGCRRAPPPRPIWA